MSFRPTHASFELCWRSQRKASELRTRAICASFLTTCCLCQLLPYTRWLYRNPKQEAAAAKRSMGVHMWKGRRTPGSTRMFWQVWGQLYNHLPTSRLDSSVLKQLVNKQLLRLSPRWERGRGSSITWAPSRSPSVWPDRGLPPRRAKHQCDRPAQGLLIPSTFCFHLPLASRTGNASGPCYRKTKNKPPSSPPGSTRSKMLWIIMRRLRAINHCKENIYKIQTVTNNYI